MATLAGVALVEVKYDPASIQKLRATTAAEGQRLSQSWNRSAQSLTRVGSTLTRSLTLPIVAAGAAATKYTYDFDQSLNHIQALVGANTQQMDYYRKSILALAPAVGQGPKALADALYFVTSSGFKGAAAMRVLEASAKGAASGLGDTKTIADLVTSAVNVYGEKNLSAAKAVDVLTQAVKDGKGEPADYAQAMGRVIPVAQNLGVSFDQVGAALSALTLGGFSADKATTGLSSIFTNLSKPSASATAALKSVGLSAAGIRQEITTKGLLPALLDLNNAFDGNAVKLRQVFTSGKAIVPFLSLTGQAAQKNVGIFNDLANSTGASNKAFETQSRTAAFTVQQSMARIQVAAVTAGGILLPIFARLATGVASVAQGFSTLPQSTQNLVIASAVGVAALGPMLTALGNTAKVARVAYQGLRLLAGAEIAAGAGATALGGAVAIMGVALAAGIIFANHLSERGSALGTAFDAASTSANDLTAAVKGLNSAEKATTQAGFAHRQAVLDVATAQKQVNLLERQGEKGTLAYKQAVLTLAEAQQRRRDTGQTLTQSQREQNKETQKASEAIATLRKRMADATKTSDQMDKTAQSVGKSLHTGADRAQEYATKMGLIHDQAVHAAAGIKNADSAAARAARSLARAAGVAQALALSLGRIPTRTDINVFVHTSQVDAARGEGTNKYQPPSPHALGGIFTKPTTIGNDLFAEKGAEGVLPLTSSYGHRALATALATAIKDTGAITGGDTTIIIDGRVLTERVDYRVQHHNRKTARRLQAGVA